MSNLKGELEMLRKSEESRLVKFDVVCLLCSVLAIFLFMVVFLFVENNLRYTCILFEGYAVWAFASSAKNIEDYIRKLKIKKNTCGKITLSAIQTVPTLQKVK